MASNETHAEVVREMRGPYYKISYKQYFAALLDYAAMVERCEKLKLNMIPHRHDKELVDYILRGDAGKEEK